MPPSQRQRLQELVSVGFGLESIHERWNRQPRSPARPLLPVTWPAPGFTYHQARPYSRTHVRRVHPAADQPGRVSDRDRADALPERARAATWPRGRERKAVLLPAGPSAVPSHISVPRVRSRHDVPAMSRHPLAAVERHDNSGHERRQNENRDRRAEKPHVHEPGLPHLNLSHERWRTGRCREAKRPSTVIHVSHVSGIDGSGLPGSRLAPVAAA